MNQFGKDHWSMLAYLETLCVDAKDEFGLIDKTKVRCNSSTHPLLSQNGFAWKESWGTRLNSGVLENHDDWDCLDDLENEGLVEVFSLTQGIVKMTSKGMAVASELRNHKASGGYYSNFLLAAA